MRNGLIAATAAAFCACFLSSLAISAPADAAQRGMASYYKSGNRTASGERFNPMGLTAAHRSLPFGTKVRVTQVKSGRSVVVRINDRGPFVGGRIIDLSLGAARAIGLNLSGVARVEIDILSLGHGQTVALDQTSTRSLTHLRPNWRTAGRFGRK